MRREFLASEDGTIIKKRGGKTPVCVVFPNKYYIGMSNLAVHILYRMLNSYDDIVCERCFLEDNGECLSIESGRPLNAFKCIFFTISFEMDFINIPVILRLSSIPVLAEDRRSVDPIIIAGGICVISNPEPIHSFIDLFIMGDIESTMPDFMKRYAELAGKERNDIIEGLNGFEWVYNPLNLNVVYNEDGTTGSFIPEDFTVAASRYRGKSLGKTAIVAKETEFSGMFLVEGTRGCPSRCPFCLLGNSYPFIYDDIIPLKVDNDDIGIVGGGISFHPHLSDITDALKRAGKVHFPSLRLDEIPISIIEHIQDEIKTLTFGIEAGSERLRNIIGKPLKDKEIYDKLSAIFSIKPFNLKLYFMIGLPGETNEDVDSIVEFAKHVRHLMIKECAKKGFIGGITIHASHFVPKPHTPFQRFPANDMDELKEKTRRLKNAFLRVDNTSFTHESVKHSFIQAAFSRGDRRLKDIVMKFAEGASLSRIMKESPINMNFYALRERGRNEVLPWDFIR